MSASVSIFWDTRSRPSATRCACAASRNRWCASAPITGIAGDLPVEPQHNTAGRAVQAMHAALGLDFGFEMDIEKGIPLGSGLGGSAASAVAAVVAANALLHTPVPRLQLLKFAMEGEIVASGSAHIDNIAPCLFGGLTLTVGIDQPAREANPGSALRLRCVLAHPHMYLGTREARAILKTDVTRSDFVWAERQSGRLHQRLLFQRSGNDSRVLQ